MLLGSVFLLLLLGRQEASSLPSDLIFQNRWPRFLDRRQILYMDLDRVSGRNSEAKELKIVKNNTYKGLESLGGAHRDPVDVLLPEAPHHPPRMSGDLVEGEGFVRHPAPRQRRLWHHLVEPESALRQRQHPSAVKRCGHHPSRQSALTEPPQHVEEWL
jgi:hypothetical protein